MSDTLIASIVGFVASVILAPLFVRFLTWITEKRSQLLVHLTWSESCPVPSLEQRTVKLLTSSEEFRSGSLSDPDKWDEVATIRSFFGANSYLRFKLLNNSRKKLANLTMQDLGTSDLYMVGTDRLKKIEKAQPITLGDLQPGRQIELHLWSGLPVPSWNENSKERFKFSADELDRIVIKEPLQRFLQQR